MIENTDAEQVERLNARVIELLREIERLRREEKHLRDLVQAYSDMAKSR